MWECSRYSHWTKRVDMKRHQIHCMISFENVWVNASMVEAWLDVLYIGVSDRAFEWQGGEAVHTLSKQAFPNYKRICKYTIVNEHEFLSWKHTGPKQPQYSNHCCMVASFETMLLVLCWYCSSVELHLHIGTGYQPTSLWLHSLGQPL